MKSFFKIANGPIHYCIDKENKVVIATMYDTAYIALDYILGTDCGQSKNGVTIVPVPRFDATYETSDDLGYLKMSDKYIARAFCHPDDEFNEEIGIKVAREKLMRNVREALDKRVLRYAKQLKTYADKLPGSLDNIKKI